MITTSHREVQLFVVVVAVVVVLLFCFVCFYSTIGITTGTVRNKEINAWLLTPRQAARDIWGRNVRYKDIRHYFKTNQNNRQSHIQSKQPNSSQTRPAERHIMRITYWKRIDELQATPRVLPREWRMTSNTTRLKHRVTKEQNYHVSYTRIG